MPATTSAGEVHRVLELATARRGDWIRQARDGATEAEVPHTTADARDESRFAGRQKDPHGPGRQVGGA